MDESKTYSQEELDAAVEEKLAAAKADGDTAFKNLWNESKKAKDAAKQYQRELSELRTKFGELEQQRSAEKAGITSAELEKVRAENLKHLEAEYAPFKQKADELMRENRTLKLDNRVKDVYAKAGVRPDRINELFKLTAEQYDLTEDGEPYLKEHAGTPIEKYVLSDVRKSYPEWFEGSGSSGGSATRSGAVSGGGPRVIPAGDNAAFLANLDGLAKGTIRVAGT